MHEISRSLSLSSWVLTLLRDFISGFFFDPSNNDLSSRFERHLKFLNHEIKMQLLSRVMRLCMPKSRSLAVKKDFIYIFFNLCFYFLPTLREKIFIKNFISHIFSSITWDWVFEGVSRWETISRENVFHWFFLRRIFVVTWKYFIFMNERKLIPFASTVRRILNFHTLTLNLNNLKKVSPSSIISMSIFAWSETTQKSISLYNKFIRCSTKQLSHQISHLKSLYLNAHHVVNKSN